MPRRAQPGSIAPTLNTTTSTILYTITSLSNSTGFYDGFGPAMGLLITVGHSASQIQASDFPYAGTIHPIGLPPPYATVSVSVVGATVGNLTVQEQIP